MNSGKLLRKTKIDLTSPPMIRLSPMNDLALFDIQEMTSLQREIPKVGPFTSVRNILTDFLLETADNGLKLPQNSLKCIKSIPFVKFNFIIHNATLKKSRSKRFNFNVLSAGGQSAEVY